MDLGNKNNGSCRKKNMYLYYFTINIIERSRRITWKKQINTLKINTRLLALLIFKIVHYNMHAECNFKIYLLSGVYNNKLYILIFFDVKQNL